MSKVTLHSTEISCDGCTNAIRIELEDLKGVKSVKGNHAKQEVTVDFGDPATLDAIKALMNEIGYPVDAVR
ncbi:MAG: heavy-metal-associated domain-containing protein [Candidatus Poribacteria bacterium]|nr:heavy-metal-associated domain-containing protein [Candidatus Poribacteria bacterium]